MFYYFIILGLLDFWRRDR